MNAGFDPFIPDSSAQSNLQIPNLQIIPSTQGPKSRKSSKISDTKSKSKTKIDDTKSIKSKKSGKEDDTKSIKSKTKKSGDVDDTKSIKSKTKKSTVGDDNKSVKSKTTSKASGKKKKKAGINQEYSFDGDTARSNGTVVEEVKIESPRSPVHIKREFGPS